MTWTAGVSHPGQCMVNRSRRQALLSLLLLPAFVVIACGPTIPAASFTATPVEGAAPLSVQFTDTSENTPTSWEWDFGDGATSTEQSPVHDYQIADTYDVTLVATNDAGSGTATTTRAITIGPGELARIEFSEESVGLEVGAAHAFSVKVWDGFDNEIPNAELSWEATAGGSVDSSGAFTAGTTAGQFEEALSLTVTRGSLTKTTKVSVTIEPGPLDQVELEPSAPTVEVGTAQEFTATAFDQFDNPIPGLTYAFQATKETGRVHSQGSLVAGTKVGVYQDGVTVEAAQGAVTKSASAKVTSCRGPQQSSRSVLPQSMCRLIRRSHSRRLYKTGSATKSKTRCSPGRVSLRPAPLIKLASFTREPEQDFMEPRSARRPPAARPWLLATLTSRWCQPRSSACGSSRQSPWSMWEAR